MRSDCKHLLIAYILYCKPWKAIAVAVGSGIMMLLQVTSYKIHVLVCSLLLPITEQQVFVSFLELEFHFQLMNLERIACLWEETALKITLLFSKLA